MSLAMAAGARPGNALAPSPAAWVGVDALFAALNPSAKLSFAVAGRLACSGKPAIQQPESRASQKNPQAKAKARHRQR